MIREYNRKSFYWGVPGVIIQTFGWIIGNSLTAEVRAIGGLMTLGGTVLLLVGLSFYAKAKGRHPAWCLMAFLSLIGLILLALLKDKSELIDSGQAPVAEENE